MLHENVDLYHTTNRTATTKGPISLAQAAGLGKYSYGNGFAVMERISGTVLLYMLTAVRVKLIYSKSYVCHGYFEYTLVLN